MVSLKTFILVKDVHPRNAPAVIVSNMPGNDTSSRLEQPLKELSPSSDTDTANTSSLNFLMSVLLFTRFSTSFNNTISNILYTRFSAKAYIVASLSKGDTIESIRV